MQQPGTNSNNHKGGMGRGIARVREGHVGRNYNGRERGIRGWIRRGVNEGCEVNSDVEQADMRAAGARSTNAGCEDELQERGSERNCKGCQRENAGMNWKGSEEIRNGILRKDVSMN